MAAFEKGHVKVGGRVKGTLNKDTRSLQDICVQYDLNPFEAMVKLAQETRDPYLKFGCLKELAKYIYPQRKAIEHSGEINNPFLDKPLHELEQLVREKLPQDIEVK